MRPEAVIIQPMLTEKSTLLQEDHNQVVFKVDLRANKIQIRQAVEKLFKVDVTSVRTQIMRGKKVRRGRHVGRRAKWKKAIVSLPEGQTVEFFEGM